MKLKNLLLVILFSQNLSIRSNEKVLGYEQQQKKRTNSNVNSQKSRSEVLTNNYPDIFTGEQKPKYIPQKIITDINEDIYEKHTSVNQLQSSFNQEIQEDEKNDFLKPESQKLETDESHYLCHPRNFRKFQYKQEAERIVNYVLYIFFLLTGFYLILFGSRFTEVSTIILGFYFAYYITLYALILSDQFKPKDLYVQLLLFFLTIIFTFLFSLLKYITEFNSAIIFAFSISFTIIAYLNLFWLGLSDPDNILLLTIIFSMAFMISLCIGICSKNFVTKIGYTLNGAILAPIHFAVLISEITALELNYLQNKQSLMDQMQILTVFVSIQFSLFLVGFLFQYFFQKRFKRGFFLNEDYEFRKSSLENA